MSSQIDNKEHLQDNQKNKYGFIIVFLFLIWLFYPNYNGFIKSCYWANNFIFCVSKILHVNNTPDYVHYRNNAIYLAKVYRNNPTPAYKEMDRAIASYSANQENGIIKTLHRDAAIIRLYYGDKDEALTELLSIRNRDANDNLRIAILMADDSRFDEAKPYCKSIIVKSQKAISGYVCMAYVYEKSGDIDTATQLYNALIQLNSNNENVYLERSYFKKRHGDEQGAAEDINKAKSIYPDVKSDGISIIDKAVNVKELPLSVM